MHSHDLSRLVNMAGQCLLSGGRVVYCGSGNDGIIAMIDASECVPTYGSGVAFTVLHYNYSDHRKLYKYIMKLHRIICASRSFS